MQGLDLPEAGRELDAAIEREVFGRVLLGKAWVQSRYDTRGEDVEPQQDPQNAAEAWVYLGHCACDIRHLLMPDNADVLGHIWQCLEVCRQFSTDIACAWELVEHFEGQDYGKIRLHGSHYHGWRGSICWGQGNGDGGDSGPLVFGVTAPEMICRAALLAVRNAGQ